MYRKTTRDEIALKSNMNGAVNETTHEYFSEMTNATRNDNNGKASEAKRQASKIRGYGSDPCTLYSLISLTESGAEVWKY